ASRSAASARSFVVLRGVLDRDDAELALPHHGVDAGDLAPHGAQPPVVLKLAGGGLEAEVEQLLLGLLELGDQDVVGFGPQVLGRQSLSHQPSPTSRLTILHFMGSLWIARMRAARATSSLG